MTNPMNVLEAMMKHIESIQEGPQPRLYDTTYCKHGMLRCTCGVCLKHPLSVAKKGGHVVGSSGGYVAVVGLGFGR